MTLPTIQAIEKRYSERSFSDQTLERTLIERLLKLAQRAPSGLNLQPWQFIIVDNKIIREQMLPICINQIQVMQAPCTIVFLADPNSWQEPFEEILQLGIENKSIDEQRRKRYRSLANSFFKTEPLGLFGLIKRIAVPLRRLFIPTPRVICSNAERLAYLRSHCMLCAATFMIAASAEGLATCPMEGFDEGRLKQLLHIPKRMTIPIIIPIGYPKDQQAKQKTTRFALSRILHINKFDDKFG